jgi:hypothetical protein
MPDSAEILNGLSLASNQYIWLNIAWHIIAFAFLVFLLTGRKINQKLVASGLSMGLLSVGYIAVQVSNPFNAFIFAFSALIFGIYTLKFKKIGIGIKWDLITVLGLILVIFGFVYPHFLLAKSWVNYIYASPMGMIPCPTISAFIGFTLMLKGFHSKRWMFTAGILGLFYGIFGVVRLKVELDIMLIAGAFFLLVYAFIWRRSDDLVKE